MQLVIIEGGEASGKTTLAYKLANSLNMRVLIKDEYKANLKKSDKKNQSLIRWFYLERETNNAIYEAIALAIKSNKSLIVEGNYWLPHKRKFLLATKNCPCIVDIECRSRAIVSLKRFIERNEAKGRPEGYKDLIRYSIVAIEVILASIGISWYKPMKFTNFLRLETTDFNKVNFDSVVKFIKDSIDK